MPATPRSDERLPLYTSNTFEIPGLELEQHLGLRCGLIVVSLGFGRSFTGGVRFDSNSLSENAVLAEFVAYGSAVVVKTG